MREDIKKIALLILVCYFMFSSCAPIPINKNPPPSPEPATSTAPPSPQTPPTETFVPSPPAFPSPIPSILGPEEEDFPLGYNPLTGQSVAEPTLLDLPALLVSISNFPVDARPQAGLSFSPMVFEFSITEGANRFLAVFYGNFPYPEIPKTGNCPVRQGVFTKTDTLLGNQVWLDANHNGLQDPGENGIGGVCVNLYDEDGFLLDQTTSDSNGYFGFDVEKGFLYTLEFIKPGDMEFTYENMGKTQEENSLDSDPDPRTGKIMLIPVSMDDPNWDAGFYVNEATPAASPVAQEMPAAAVGPVRSGRLLYAHLGAFFQNSCLIYAFASREVLEVIPKCSFVTHEVAGGGSMLAIERLEAIARGNGKTKPDFNYSSNMYDEIPPPGGIPANQINVFFALLNQAGWIYDQASGTYHRYTDNAEKATAGQLHPDTDRLNGRQVQFENIVVIMADHEVISPTNLDIHLDQGEEEYAWLFRDGQGYKIKWSTRSTAYERTTGKRRPIRFIKMDGSPMALKPGRTWVIIVTPFSLVTEERPGIWRVRFYAPVGAATGG